VKSILALRQFNPVRLRGFRLRGFRLRGFRRIRTIRHRVSAPDATLTVVKLAASISSGAKASLHSNELAANATMAMAVIIAVRVAV
jgi:hypothetical protein